MVDNIENPKKRNKMNFRVQWRGPLFSYQGEIILGTE